MVGLCYFCDVERFNEIINFGEKLAKLPKAQFLDRTFGLIFCLFCGLLILRGHSCQYDVVHIRHLCELVITSGGEKRWLARTASWKVLGH